MSNCRSCGQQIVWIKLVSGKLNPCDPQKHSIKEGNGDMVIVTVDGRVVRGTPCSYDDGADTTGYISHFATCQNAGQWRRRG